MYATGYGGDALAGFALRAAVWLLTRQCGRGGPRGGDELREGLGNEQARYYEEEQETATAQAAPAKRWCPGAHAGGFRVGGFRSLGTLRTGPELRRGRISGVAAR